MVIILFLTLILRPAVVQHCETLDFLLLFSAIQIFKLIFTSFLFSALVISGNKEKNRGKISWGNLLAFRLNSNCEFNKKNEMNEVEISASFNFFFWWVIDNKLNHKFMALVAIIIFYISSVYFQVFIALFYRERAWTLMCL